MSKSCILIVVFVFFFIFSLIAHSESCDPSLGPCQETPTNPSPFSSDSNSYPDYSQPGSPIVNSPPPNPLVINGVQIKDYKGLSVSGNTIKFSSASYAKSNQFIFNDILDANLNDEDGKLHTATVTSLTNNNILTINNPLDPLQIEKINIHLNKSQSVEYKYDEVNQKIEINLPEKSFINITKGNSKSILVESNGPDSFVVMEKTGISYQEIEESYDLYENGKAVNEYSVLKENKVNEIFPTNNTINYGYESNNEMLLKGIIDYRRLQSFNQLKGITGTYANYMDLKLPFLTAYLSLGYGNGENLKASNESYDSFYRYSENENLVSIQNYDNHEILLRSKEYFYKYNIQECPNYNKLIATTPENEKIKGKILLQNNSLRFGNFKIYTERTKDFEKIEDKLKKMIITNNPENFAMVNLE